MDLKGSSALHRSRRSRLPSNPFCSDGIGISANCSGSRNRTVRDGTVWGIAMAALPAVRRLAGRRDTPELKIKSSWVQPSGRVATLVIYARRAPP